MSQLPRNTRASEIDLDLASNKPLRPTSLLGSVGIQLSIERDKPGKQHGHLKLPVVTHNGTPRQLHIPVCIINGDKPGPTATLLAGIHGDEYEGSITVHRLARELTADQVHGRLFLLPCVNPAGLSDGSRCNPADGQNIDYAFPGNKNGSTSEMIAHQLTQLFIEDSDIVVDLRSGGRHLQFIPSVAVRFDKNRQKHTSAEDAMIAFGAPNSLRLPPSAPDSCLQGMVSAMGKDYIQAELGGGTGYGVKALSIAHKGCLNVLRHLTLLNDELTLSSTRLLEVRDDSYYVFAPEAGVYEPLSYLGETVWDDTPMANVLSLFNTQTQAVEILPPRSATLVASHPGGFVNTGDLIAILAEEVQA